MMLGRELLFPSHLVFRPPLEKDESSHEYVKKFKEQLQYTHEVARKHSEGEYRKQKKHYDRKAWSQQIPEGSLV